MTLKNKTRWFKVDDVTSVTKEEENERQQKAKSDSGRRNDTCTGHEADSPGQPAQRARTDNASLLKASIDLIFSSEKLNGDTVNLHFDFLRNSRAFGGGSWGFASSYFYPSLHRPFETSTCSKHHPHLNVPSKRMIPIVVYSNIVGPGRKELIILSLSCCLFNYLQTKLSLPPSCTGYVF